MSYVDGFLIAVPTAEREAFRKHVLAATAVFQEHGARRVVNCWGDDVPPGKLTDMHRAVKAEPGETICFGWIEWPSKEARDQGMAKARVDSRMQPDANPMPFDGRRMIYGGFVPVHDTGR